MKCVKNNDGNIRRVKDEMADTLVKMGWGYCSKQAWKEQVRDVGKLETKEEGVVVTKDKANLKVKKSGKNKGGVK